MSYQRKLYKVGKIAIDKIHDDKDNHKKWLQITHRFGMDAFWTILSENSDPDGIRFVSTLEAKDYPFYAIQVLHLV